jgi:hypothetical protein
MLESTDRFARDCAVEGLTTLGVPVALPPVLPAGAPTALPPAAKRA